MDIISIILVIAFLVAVPIDFIFLRIVRRNHPDVWQELGSPTAFHSEGGKIYRYFFRRRYRAIPDRGFLCGFVILFSSRS